MSSTTPPGYGTVTPWIISADTARLIDFAKAAFGAEELARIPGPGGEGIGHAEVRIGDSVVMLGEAQDPWKPMPSTLYLYVPDTDATYRRALDAGATSLMEPADQFYGDRNAGVKDPTGNLWWIATHKEDVSPEEMARRPKAHQKPQSHG